MNNNLSDIDGDSLQNLQYFAGLTQAEGRRVRALMQPFLDGEAAGSREAVEQMVRILAELSARVRVIERAAEQQLLAENPLYNGPLLFGELALPCNKIDSAGLYDMETDQDGEPIRWTRTEELSLRLPLHRNREKRLRVYYGAIIKPEYARSLEIRIDGKAVPHKARRTKQGLCLECRLPQAKDLAMTDFTLRLPSVHAPSDFTDSSDHRMLGIAIRRIVVESASFTRAPHIFRH